MVGRRLGVIGRSESNFGSGYASLCELDGASVPGREGRRVEDGELGCELQRRLELAFPMVSCQFLFKSSEGQRT